MINLNQTIKVIADIPNNYFKSIVFDGNDGEADLYVKGIKHQYMYLGLWLSYHFNERWLCFDLRNSNAKYYKPLGDRSKAIWDFIGETKLLSNKLESINDHWLWYAIEYEIFENTLENSGLFKKPVLKGKRCLYNEQKTQEKVFSDTDNIVCLGIKKTYSPTNLLMSEAIDICKIRENFEYKEIYRKFHKCVTSCQRRLYTTKEIQTTYLKDGKLIQSGDGKRKTRQNIK